MTSTHTTSTGDSPRNTVDNMAGLLAAVSVVLSGIAFARTPALLTPIAAILAFAAGRMSSRNGQLASVAAFLSFIAFVVGMTLAVITEHSLL